jgi:pimeloyl-ACP methyl ester carboxylesterase
LREVFYDPSRVTAEEIDEYLAPLERPGETAALLSLRRSEPPSVFAMAARVQVPTLILWGREDHWLPVERADRFLQAIPGAKLEILEACGHLPQEEQPQAVVKILGRFLDGA